jgi:hypothetical protein
LTASGMSAGWMPGGRFRAFAAENLGDGGTVDAELAGEFGDAGASLVRGGLFGGEVFLVLFPGRSRCQRCGCLWQVE